MASAAEPTASGLDGVVVAETRLSRVDGKQGELTIGGFLVEDLAERASFEHVLGLLWAGGGELPNAASSEETRKQLGEARVTAWERRNLLGDALQAKNGMDALRAAIAHLQVEELEEWAATVRIAGAMVVYASEWAAQRAGRTPTAPDPDLSQAADYLRMVRGSSPRDAEVRALDRYLVTVSDHGFNASTFTARVVASTGSDLGSSIVAAICALKGPLHGGAPGPVLDMLDAIGTPDNARPWIERELDAGRRIMGMGHRVYRVRDPRAAVFEKAVEELEQAGLSSERLRLARAVEHSAEEVLKERHPERGLRANVEFYTAVLLEAVGMPREIFSPTFAAGRVAGWCAHVREQRTVGRLVRPSSRYVGIEPARA